jgi:hypothetical protein
MSHAASEKNFDVKHYGMSHVASGKTQTRCTEVSSKIDANILGSPGGRNMSLKSRDKTEQRFLGKTTYTLRNLSWPVLFGHKISMLLCRRSCLELKRL